MSLAQATLKESSFVSWSLSQTFQKCPAVAGGMYRVCGFLNEVARGVDRHCLSAVPQAGAKSIYLFRIDIYVLISMILI